MPIRYGRVGRGAVPALLAVAAQAAAAIFLTWPLTAHIATHLPATSFASLFDPLMIGWALAHQSRSLSSDPSAFADGGIFHPAPHSLFFGETGFGAVPYFLPTFLVSGNPTLALNLVFLGCTTLTAAAMHCLVRRLCGSWLAGLVAGWVVLTTPFVTWSWLPVAPNYAVLQYLPLVMLLAAQPMARVGQAMRLAGVVALQGFTSPYVAVATAAPLALLAAARVLDRTRRVAGAYLIVALALAGLAIAGIYAGHLLVRVDDPEFATRTHWAMPATAPFPRAVGAWWRFLVDAAVPLTAYPVIVVGAVLRLRRVGGWDDPAAAFAWRLGAFWAFAGTIIALRPAIESPWGTLPLPHMLLASWTPIYDVVRIPERLGIAGMMGHAVLAGLGFAECCRAARRSAGGRLPRRAAVACALLVLLGVGRYAECQRQLAGPLLVWPASYPLAPAITPDSTIVPALLKSDGPLLELPVDPGPRPHAVAMYRAIFHGRRLLNGYSGYWPRGFEQRMELARRLPDPDALTTLRRETDLTAILVHTAALSPPARAVWEALAERDAAGPLRLVVRSGSDLLFEFR